MWPASAQDFHRIEPWKESGVYDTACKALATDTEQQVEAHLATTFGRDVWLNMRFSTFHSGGEKHLLVFVYDVIEHKRVEQELREKEQELSVLFEELPVGVSMLDQNRKVTYANARLEEILGLSQDDLLQGKHQEPPICPLRWDADAAGGIRERAGRFGNSDPSTPWRPAS